MLSAAAGGPYLEPSESMPKSCECVFCLRARTLTVQVACPIDQNAYKLLAQNPAMGLASVSWISLASVFNECDPLRFGTADTFSQIHVTRINDLHRVDFNSSDTAHSCTFVSEHIRLPIVH